MAYTLLHKFVKILLVQRAQCHGFFEYGMNLLSCDTTNQMLIQFQLYYFNDYIHLMDTTIKTIFNVVFCVAQFFSIYLAMHVLYSIKNEVNGLFYSIANKFNCISFITDSIGCNKSSLIIKWNNVLHATRINTSKTIVLPESTQYKNFICVAMLFEHDIISWLFSQIYQILIDFNNYSLKLFILNVTNGNYICLIGKTKKNVVLFVVKLLQVVLQCLSYNGSKTAESGLVYSITVEFSCILFSSNCICFNGTNLICHLYK